MSYELADEPPVIKQDPANQAVSIAVDGAASVANNVSGEVNLQWHYKTDAV